MNLETELPPLETNKPRIPLHVARASAELVVEALAPGCHQIEIAGSIRRGKADVGDIEIVALPIPDEDLFGEPTTHSTAFETALVNALRSHLLRYDSDQHRNGGRWKRFRFAHVMPDDPRHGLAIDLFIADRDNYGNTLAIRTGCGLFSQALMMRARQFGLQQGDGYLHDCANKAARVSCPTEETYFERLHLDWIEPAERTELRAEHLFRLQQR